MNAPPQIRVLCVDDHPIVREGIAGAIGDEPDMLLVAAAVDGPDAVKAFRQYRPDVTLMDLQMPGMNGVEAIILIRKGFPFARIVVLTTYDGDAQTAQAIKAGAQGYLLKSMSRDQMLNTIRLVHAGERSIPPEIAGRLTEFVDKDSLTAREIEVLSLVATGHSNKLTAAKLALSEETIKEHMSNILAKLSANDRTHAVTIARKRGFLVR